MGAVHARRVVVENVRMSTEEISSSRLPPHTFGLSMALALVGGVSAALTFFLSDLVLGPPVTVGNARGTALVMLAVAVPLLLASMWWTHRGSWRAPYLWLGSLFYLGYNAFLLLFLIPFNSLFLLYVGTQSLALFATAALVRALDVRALVSRGPSIPVKGLAFFVWAIVAFNALAWLRVVVPAIFSEQPDSFLDGLGVATNAIYVQDLALWLPLMSLAAWWMWRRRPWGIVMTGSWLLFGAIEAVGIAVDQWFGHQADPLSPHASTEIIPPMLGLAAASAIGFSFYVRGSSNEEARTRPEEACT